MGRVHAPPGRNPLVKEITFDESYSQLNLRTPYRNRDASVRRIGYCLPKDGDTGAVCLLSWPLEALERGQRIVG
jgi:hypothetical protein